jgi:hypothetical protein
VKFERETYTGDSSSDAGVNVISGTVGSCSGTAISVEASDVKSSQEDSDVTLSGEGSGATFLGGGGDDEALSEIDIGASDG